MNRFKIKVNDLQLKKRSSIPKIIYFSSMRSRCRDGLGPKKEEHSRCMLSSKTFCLQSLIPLPPRSRSVLTSSGTPESRVGSIRDRLNIIRQCVLRNEHFAPSTLPSRDREKLVTVSYCVYQHKLFVTSWTVVKIYQTIVRAFWRKVLAAGNVGIQQGREVMFRRFGWTR